MIPQVSGFIPGPLEYTDNYIEVADVHYITAKQNVPVQIIMCGDNIDPFIVTLYETLLALDLYNMLFLIVKSMNLGHIARCNLVTRRKMR